MGFKKNWDVADIAAQIRQISVTCSSPYTDGILSFELKKDLYQIKELVDRALSDAPTFGKLEDDWLKDQEQKRIINFLKKR